MQCYYINVSDEDYYKTYLMKVITETYLMKVITVTYLRPVYRVPNVASFLTCLVQHVHYSV
jgi:hypothetical protein